MTPSNPNGIITVQAPASKSLSHRTLIAGSLANGQSIITGLLDSDDIKRTMDCLSACGASFSDTEGGAVRVQGMEDGPRGGNHDGRNRADEPHELFVHESGTTCRLMTAVAAAGKGTFRVHGAPRMHERPMKELVEALSRLGVRFTFEEQEGHLPFVMETKGYRKKTVDITLEESSQYLSGLLLGAPLSEKHVLITVSGKKAVSWPYVALTLQIMEDFKAAFAVEILKDGRWTEVPWRSIRQVEPGALRFHVEASGFEAANYRVEGDWSNSSYFLAAGAIGKHPVKVLGIGPDSHQGDHAIIDILAQMGAGLNVTPDKGITIYPRKLRGINVDMGKCPDLVPTVAVVAAHAVSPTTIRNVAHLRIKECDRLQACAEQIAKTGCKVEQFDDGMTITPAPLASGTAIDFETYGDHRIAMSMSLFELSGISPNLDNPACVGKSFPQFFEEWEKVVEGQ